MQPQPPALFLILNFSFLIESLFVAHGGTDDFIGRGQAGEDFADAVFAQRSHAHLARPRAQYGSGGAVIN
jgi:hypothetical protein